jgi:Fuc2NAc and GlcNAc transferase
MHDLLVLIVFFTSIIFSWLVTSRIRVYAINSQMLDIPNQRSSHDTPTPRGGGVSIVAAMLIAGSLLLLLPGKGTDQLLSLLFVILAFAVLGWQDDRHDLSALSRLLVQLLISTVCVSYLVSSGELAIAWTGFAWLLAMGAMILWVTWMANLYNFMDGIDGISGVETVVLAAIVSYWFASHESFGLAILSISAAGAALGFLRWNWAPAMIFMGDVGSLALGGFFAVIAIIGAGCIGIPFSAFLILYGVYLADATVTLFRRILKGEKWWSAHRSHYYQRAVQSGYTHAQVSLAVLAINCVLALIATFVVSGLLPAYAGLMISALILASLMFLIHSRHQRIQST